MLPKLKGGSESLCVVTDIFKGLNRGEDVMENEFTDMENISAGKYPAMTARACRAVLYPEGDIGAMCVHGGFAYVSGTRFYYNGKRISSLSLTSGEKSLVGANNKIYIFPDKKWFDVSKSTVGSMERKNTVSEGLVVITPALKAFADAPIHQSDTQPVIENPKDFEGNFWLDSASVPCKLKRYIFDGNSGDFVEVTPDCVRIAVADVNGNPQNSAFEGFEEGEGITLSGSGPMESVLSSLGLCSTFVVARNGYTKDNMRYLILDTTVKGHRNHFLGLFDDSDSFTLERKVPSLDKAVFCANRIFGYSVSENRIYCSRKNSFNAFYGESFSLDDPASFDAGTPGDFNGVIALGDTPLFLKEGYLHKFVGLSQNVIPCRGLSYSDRKSLCVLKDSIIFKSGADILSYNGVTFAKLSEKLGALEGNCEGSAILHDTCYLNIADSDKRRIYVYNAERKLWHIEDSLDFSSGVTYDGALCVATHEGVHILSRESRQNDLSTGVSWFAESGDFKVKEGLRKALSRIVIRCRMEKGASLNVYVMYDNDGNYIFVGKGEEGLCSVPILPRRCDRLKIRLEGEGGFTLNSLVRIYTKASSL